MFHSFSSILNIGRDFSLDVEQLHLLKDVIQKKIK